MIIKKEKFLKIAQVLLVFIVIDFVSSSLMKINGLMGIALYMLSGALIILYGLFLLKKKDVFILKTYFYFIILLGLIKIFLRIISNIQ